MNTDWTRLRDFLDADSILDTEACCSEFPSFRLASMALKSSWWAIQLSPWSFLYPTPTNLTYLYHTLYTLNHFLYFLTLLISNFAILPINIINNHYHTFQKLNLLFLCTTISLQQIFCFLKVYLFPLEICFHFLSISLDKKRSHVVVESMSQSGPQFLICLKYSIINK